MLKYWTYFKYVSTHSVSSETYNQIFRTKTYNINNKKKKSFNKIRGREIEKRKRGDHPWEPCVTLLDILLSTPLLSVKVFTFDWFVESSTEATDHVLCKLRKKGNWHSSYNIYFFFAAI